MKDFQIALVCIMSPWLLSNARGYNSSEAQILKSWFPTLEVWDLSLAIDALDTDDGDEKIVLVNTKREGRFYLFLSGEADRTADHERIRVMLAQVVDHKKAKETLEKRIREKGKGEAVDQTTPLG
jgi:hypothetical protein